MADHTRTEGKRLAAAHGPAIGEFTGKIGIPFIKGSTTYIEPRLNIFNEAMNVQN